MKRMLLSGLLALAMIAGLAAPSRARADDGPDTKPRNIECTDAKAVECEEIRDLMRRYSQAECPKGTQGIEVAGRCIATGRVLELGSGLPLYKLHLYDDDLSAATINKEIIWQELQISKQLSIITENKVTKQTIIMLAKYITNIANAAPAKDVLLFGVAGSLADAILDSGASSTRPEGRTPLEFGRRERPMKPIHTLEAISPDLPPFFVPAALLVLVRSDSPPTAVRPGITGIAVPPVEADPRPAAFPGRRRGPRGRQLNARSVGMPRK